MGDFMNLATKFTLTLPIEFEGEGGEMGRATSYFEMGAKAPTVPKASCFSHRARLIDFLKKAGGSRTLA